MVDALWQIHLGRVTVIPGTDKSIYLSYESADYNKYI